MTQERQDGWYPCKWPRWSASDSDSIQVTRWRPAWWDSANQEWVDQGFRRTPLEIGPRLLMPDEPKDDPEAFPGELMELRRAYVAPKNPDLLAVVAAAKEYVANCKGVVNAICEDGMVRSYFDVDEGEWVMVPCQCMALREALAKWKEGS